MNWLKKIKSFAVLMFVLSFLISASLSSCESKGKADDKESAEHPAADSVEKADHPKAANENEHPKKDSTNVQ